VVPRVTPVLLAARSLLTPTVAGVPTVVVLSPERTTARSTVPLPTSPVGSPNLSSTPSSLADKSSKELVEIINANFDMRPGVIVKELDLINPIYRQTAKNGHFSNPNFTWEKPKTLKF
jgi:hypothetical protein